MGRGSDPDGTVVQHRWEQLGGPVVTLSSATVASPTFTSPRVSGSTHLDFRFTVTDDKGASASDEVRITVDPSVALCSPTAPPSSLGLRRVDPTFESRLQQAYSAAMAAGLWANTYAATSKEEYWAEGVQDWFNVNLEAEPPNGIHNSINTRAELKVYDPGLHQLISEVMPADWQPSCPPLP